MSCIGIISKNTRYMKFEFNSNVEISIKNGEFFIKTSAEFDFCSLVGQYMPCNSFVVGFFNHIGDDYSNYDENRCNTGGNYGYDFYCLMAIEEVSIEDIDIDELEEVSIEDFDIDELEEISIEDFDIDELEEVEEVEA